MRSNTFERIGKIEIGRKSVAVVGLSHLGMEQTRLILHWSGKEDIEIQVFMMCVSADVRKSRTGLMNFTGILS